MHAQTLPFRVWEHCAAALPAGAHLPHGAICIAGGRSHDTSSGFNQRVYVLALGAAQRCTCHEAKLRCASMHVPVMQLHALFILASNSYCPHKAYRATWQILHAVSGLE